MESQNKQIPTGILSRVYSLGVTAAAPFVAAGLACSARGRRRYGERFGVWGDVPPSAWWMHGASVGEVQGLLPLIGEVRTRHPEQSILLTSTSPTGLDRAGDSVTTKRLLPMDAPWCVRRALSSARTERFVLAETELWPVFLRELMMRGTPCHIVNGRISDYTLRRYQVTRSIFAPLLERISTVCVASQTQGDRYRELGVRPEVIHVTGHTKYDSAPKVNETIPRGQLRNDFFQGLDHSTPVITLGSVHPGEESVWLDAAQAIRCEGKRVKIVLAPRHMERVPYFIEALKKTNLSWARWSEHREGSEYDVLLLDVMGRLEEGYAIASLAFIGATLVDIGGHNPLEAAMYGAPVVVGPYTSVISDVLDDMRVANALAEIQVGESVRGLLERVVNGDPALREAGERGHRVWSHHRGAAHRVVSVIEHG